MLKLGCVPYLNALPLVEGLNPTHCEMIRRPPAELYELLVQNKVDAALLPIVHAFEDPRLFLVPGIAIASLGPVWSVKLFKVGDALQKTWKDLRHICLDEESKSSNLLLQTLFHHYYGIAPEAMHFTLSKSSQPIEAQLLIGDKALQHFGESLDLGEVWTSWTGKPFVYAAWMSFHGRHPSLVECLRKAKAYGQEHLDDLAKKVALFSKEFVKGYFKKALCYNLEEKELEGIQLFYDYLKPLTGYSHALTLKFVSQD